LIPAQRLRHRAAIVIGGTLLLIGAIALVRLALLPPQPVLDRVRQSGELVVAVREAPTTMHLGADGPDGFEYALVRGLAESLGVGIRFVRPGSLAELLAITESGQVHMASAGLTVTPARAARLAFSSAYDEVTEQVIYRRGNRRPRDVDDIDPGDLHVVAGSSHEETLRNLRAGHPSLSWQVHRDAGIAGLLEAIDQDAIRLTVADANEAALSRRLYQNIAVAFDLGGPMPIAWAFPRRDDTSLLDAANAYLAGIEGDGRLQRLRARYFGHSGRLDFVETRTFWRNVRDRLPKYREMFEAAGEATGIDWRLLAAIGYQESHWNPDAVSPTGVRGIMMLTSATARQMKIKNRRDPAQSIHGGARYLRVVGRKIPQRITDPNRMWLTLAGYNIGFGHLEDARILTERDGGNPDLWMDVKQRLPLLEKKAYYKTVKHGFARGREPVRYVDHIRNYYDMLVWFTTTADTETRERLLAQADD
jgi:membrane-bound lytic murein transglycosylase F